MRRRGETGPFIHALTRTALSCHPAHRTANTRSHHTVTAHSHSAKSQHTVIHTSKTALEETGDFMPTFCPECGQGGQDWLEHQRPCSPDGKPWVAVWRKTGQVWWGVHQRGAEASWCEGWWWPLPSRAPPSPLCTPRTTANTEGSGSNRTMASQTFQWRAQHGWPRGCCGSHEHRPNG